jgi:hypothetical protein
MDVNDNAGCLAPRVALASIASMLAPTREFASRESMAQAIKRCPPQQSDTKNKYDTSFYV